MRDTHLFTIARPGRTAVPCKFGIRPPGRRSPPTPRSLACRLRFRVAGLRAAAAAASAGGPAGGSSLALAPTSGRGTAAGRASSARPRPRRSAARMLQCGASAPPTGPGPARAAVLPPPGELGLAAFCALHRSQASLSLAQFLACRFSRKDLFP